MGNMLKQLYELREVAIMPPPGNWDQEEKNSRKHKINSLIPISWVNFCNDSLFADMTLTLHKSQFTVLAYCSHETAAHLICSFGVNAGCETWERIVLLLAFVASQ